jgi:hypothetical protein
MVPGHAVALLLRDRAEVTERFTVPSSSDGKPRIFHLSRFDLEGRTWVLKQGQAEHGILNNSPVAISLFSL